MPVGTAIALATDEGVVIEAVVTEIREQVAGADRAPGMKIVPVLAGATASWWQARVALPDEEPVTASAKPTTVVEGSVIPDSKRTTVMPAVDQELLAQLTKDTNIELFSTARHAIVDDGNRTTVMTAMDPAALGLDDSGPVSTEDGEASGDGEREASPEGDKLKSPRKRRVKKKP